MKNQSIILTSLRSFSLFALSVFFLVSFADAFCALTLPSDALLIRFCAFTDPFGRPRGFFAGCCSTRVPFGIFSTPASGFSTFSAGTGIGGTSKPTNMTDAANRWYISAGTGISKTIPFSNHSGVHLASESLKAIENFYEFFSIEKCYPIFQYSYEKYTGIQSPPPLPHVKTKNWSRPVGSVKNSTRKRRIMPEEKLQLQLHPREVKMHNYFREKQSTTTTLKTISINRAEIIFHSIHLLTGSTDRAIVLILTAITTFKTSPNRACILYTLHQCFRELIKQHIKRYHQKLSERRAVRKRSESEI